ncbi:MAG TPA: rod shape-determining protein RodA, partial [Gammaproteobacteria bacterium]|nr:rod shape-determining protein RodA [Gammaproteobacteria bacterium]
MSRLIDKRREDASQRGWQQLLHLDGTLLFGLILVSAFGLAVLYSASGQSSEALLRQGIRLGLAFGAMVALAQ